MTVRTFENYLPLIAVQLLLVLALLAFVYGPWDWEYDYRTVVYLLSANLIIAIFYVFAPRFLGQPIATDQTAGSARDLDVKWVKAAIILAVLFAVPTSMARIGAPLPPMLAGVVNPGASYAVAYERSLDIGQWVFVEYGRMIAAPLLVSYLFLAIVYWNRISVFFRTTAILTALFYIAISLAAGKNRLIGDVLIGATFVLVIASTYWRAPFLARMSSILAFIGILFIIFLGLFYRTQIFRAGEMVSAGSFSYGSTIVLTDRSGDSLAPAGEQIRDLTGSVLGPLVGLYESFTRYLTQGYQALAFSLDLEHSSTFGFGNSMFLARNADRLFGTDYFTTQSLPGLLQSENGWPYFNLWHSIYPWIASDVGWIGALFAIGILAGLLSISWRDALQTRSVPAIILSIICIQILFYVPSSNAILQDGEGLFAFLIGLVWYAVTLLRRRIAGPRQQSENLGG